MTRRGAGATGRGVRRAGGRVPVRAPSRLTFVPFARIGPAQ